MSGRGIGLIVPADSDRLWVSTNNATNIFNAINIFNTLTGKSKIENFQKRFGIKADALFPVMLDTVRQIVYMIASPQNIMYKINLKTGQSKTITFGDGTKQLDKLEFEAMIAQPYKNGFLIYDMNHGFFEVGPDSPVAHLIIPFHDFIGRMEIVEDSLLFAKNPNFPYNYSFSNHNGKWTRTPHLLDSLDWGCIYYDETDQTIWTDLLNKLTHFDKNFHIIKSYGKEDGFFGTPFKMLEDKSGNIWYVNSQKQISRVNVTTGIISTLAPQHGYQPQFFDWFTPGTKDSKGSLYFGESSLGTGNIGLIRIDPEKYVSSNPSTVYFNALNINYKPYPLSTGVNNLNELFLSHDQNNLSIETGIIDYYSMGKSHLRYKLKGEGKTAEWQYAPAYFTIRYDGLTPGDYELILQSSNAGNEFIGPEKILSIHVRPPWWQTWWARLIFIFVFASALWSFIRYRSRSLRQKNLVLEEKVMNRTKELKHSLEELRETQAHLIQREKMASLGELTAGIAHEIQNPLNFVNNFSDLNKELLEELKAEKKQLPRNHPLEEQLLIDIQENEDKINHHGRRAAAIVKGMLLHSRTSTGQKEPADINALSDEFLRLSYHGLRAKDKSFNANLVTAFDPHIEEIYVVPGDIGRVLLNLFNNAFYSVNEKKKLQPSNYEPAVTVSTRKLEKMVEIRIRDNGIGIPQNVLEKIYQPFFTTKPPGEGTGLGLSLSYDIITKIHSGELKVETKQGEFAEFIILLPT